MPFACALSDFFVVGNGYASVWSVLLSQNHVVALLAVQYMPNPTRSLDDFAPETTGNALTV